MRLPRLSDERGFTLPELIVSMSVGLVVLLAAFLVFDRSFSVSNEVADRADALQRGRLAMEEITRQLRAQVCLGDDTDPIVQGLDNSVTFHADLSNGDAAATGTTGPGKRNPEKRTLTYDPATKTIREFVYAGGGSYPDLVFGAAPTTTRTLLTKVDPVLVGATPQPVFRYYAYKVGGTPGEVQALTTPLSIPDAVTGAPGDTSKVVMIRVAFVTLPERTRPRDRDSLTLENDIYVRIADPADPVEGPRCI